MTSKPCSEHAVVHPEDLRVQVGHIPQVDIALREVPRQRLVEVLRASPG